MIEPTVGRVVWFWPGGMKRAGFTVIDRRQPCAAQIVFVHSDCDVNLSVADHRGLQWPIEGVYLDQNETPGQVVGSYCTWMPYQKGQAAKTEQLKRAQKPAA